MHWKLKLLGNWRRADEEGQKGERLAMGISQHRSLILDGIPKAARSRTATEIFSIIPWPLVLGVMEASLVVGPK